jgi:glycosyltransferase involved in cell wall biosynthesis
MTLPHASRIALVHDWLTGMRGGEKCLELLCEAWPEAKLHTLIHRRGSVSSTIENLNPRATWMNALPGVSRYYRYLLPVMPMMARWPIQDADLIFSLSHCIAKAAKPSQGVPHFCYCFSPMRYAWHMKDSYFADRVRGMKARAVDSLLSRLRAWDLETSARVTHFIAISETIRVRIKECYNRESEVIFPPVDTDFYTLIDQPREDFYLIVSAMAPYKRIDLAIQACQRLQKRLVLIGTGQDAKRLQAISGPESTWLGWQPNEVIRDHLRRCKALLFPGEEDFGIVPVEANACGCPVIAFGKGGITETIIPDSESRLPTGIFFDEQKVDALIEAMEHFERNRSKFNPIVARKQAENFRADRFVTEIESFISGRLRK